jgi:hypothetical protein
MIANKMGMTIGGTNQAAMAATPARYLGSSYSGDAPLGMHAGQQQNKHDCCRREEKKVCGRDWYALNIQWRLYNIAHCGRAESARS